MRILADLHTHTISSGHAYSTLLENAAVAAEKGLQILGMTDHGPSMPGAPNLYHFGNFSVIPDELFGVKILPGVEANITSHEGELDIPLRYLAKMKIVLAGLHVFCYSGGTTEENTQAYLKAMNNPYVDMMVHPGRSEFDLDLERIAQTSSQLEIPVEINNSSLANQNRIAWDNCCRFAKYMAKYKGPIILASDAHFCNDVGDFTKSFAVVREAGIQEEQILNTDPRRILHYLKQRRFKHPPV